MVAELPPSAPSRRDREDALAGLLLGTALGDALGLPAEGLNPTAVRRRFGAPERFHLLGRRGFVSDDTEQSALVAQCIAQAKSAGQGIDVERCALLFRRALVGWFLRLPFGIGMATLKACLRALLGFRMPGVRSAGNGAAMRAPVVGAAFADQPTLRRQLGRRLAELTHRDPRAVEGALFAAEVAAHASVAGPHADRRAMLGCALEVVRDESLRTSLARALEFAEAGGDEAPVELGSSGFVLHTLALASFCFARWGDRPLLALQKAIAAGGDADTNAAIVGAWCGALGGASSLPAGLLTLIDDGLFGPSHLRALAAALAQEKAPPAWSATRALLRNLLLYPVILAHGLRRLLPS